MKRRKKASIKLIQAQEKLQRRERLANVGQLSSNIAHELRNPMTAMRNSVYFVRSRSMNDSKILEHLDMIDNVLSEGDELIERLLEKTRDKKLKIRETNVEKLCLDSLLVSDPLGLAKIKFLSDNKLKPLKLDKLLF